MEEIKHEYILVDGLKLHVAQIGSSSSPPAVFLHGFPEIWYSWRHQMIAVAKAGFRAVAFDYRGYGLSDQPRNPKRHLSWTFWLTSLLFWMPLQSPRYNVMRDQVFLIGKDFGASVVSLFCLLHRERVSGFVTLGVPFAPPRRRIDHQDLPEGFYMLRWQEPGRAEADFGRLDAKTVVRNVYILFSKSELPIASENQEIMDLVEPSEPLPHWFSEEDLAVYGELYEKSGFRTALQVPYGKFGLQLDIPDPKVEVPALLIMGKKDYAFKFPGMSDYIKSGMVKMFVPKLEIVYLPEGSHFVQEQSPEEVNDLIVNFIKGHV